jgi:hypothetical protein
MPAWALCQEGSGVQIWVLQRRVLCWLLMSARGRWGSAFTALLLQSGPERSCEQHRPGRFKPESPELWKHEGLWHLSSDVARCPHWCWGDRKATYWGTGGGGRGGHQKWGWQFVLHLAKKAGKVCCTPAQVTGLRMWLLLGLLIFCLLPLIPSKFLKSARKCQPVSGVLRGNKVLINA